MIGTNKVILNEATVKCVFEKYIQSDLFKDGEFTVTNVYHKSYEYEWEITLEGKEDSDAG